MARLSALFTASGEKAQKNSPAQKKVGCTRSKNHLKPTKVILFQNIIVQ